MTGLNTILRYDCCEILRYSNWKDERVGENGLAAKLGLRRAIQTLKSVELYS